MSKKVIVKERQTIWDLAIQEYGSVDGAFKILADNLGIDLETDLVPNSILLINSDPINKDVVNYLVEKSISLANQPDKTDLSSLLLEDSSLLLMEDGSLILI
jgi:hypothetical protein